MGQDPDKTKAAEKSMREAFNHPNAKPSPSPEKPDKLGARVHAGELGDVRRHEQFSLAASSEPLEWGHRPLGPHQAKQPVGGMSRDE